MADPEEQQPRGVFNPHVVDLISFDDASGEVVLSMLEERPWSGGDAQLREVEAKFNAYLEYVLGGRWNSLFIRCGIDDAAGEEGAAVFRVIADGKVLAEFTRAHGESPRPVRLAVKGVDRLVLEARAGDSYISDFCNWAEARVYR